MRSSPVAVEIEDSELLWYFIGPSREKINVAAARHGIKGVSKQIKPERLVELFGPKANEAWQRAVRGDPHVEIVSSRPKPRV